MTSATAYPFILIVLRVYTARESWREIDVEHLMICMRSVFMKWKTEIATQESQEAIKRARKFSHKEVGLKLKEILNDH